MNQVEFIESVKHAAEELQRRANDYACSLKRQPLFDRVGQSARGLKEANEACDKFMQAVSAMHDALPTK